MYGYNYPQINAYDKQIQEERQKIAELERQKLQLYTQPTILNQTIQAGPQQNNFKYAESIDEINREMVFSDTLFVNKTFTNLWLKNPKGEVKTWLLEEIKPKDEKDFLIENLQLQIEQLKKELKNNEQSELFTGDTTTTKGSVSSTVSKTRGNEEK